MGDLDNLVANIYEASTDSEQWEDVLQQLVHELGFDIGPSHLMASDWDGNHCFLNETTRTDDQLAEIYLKDFFPQDFRVPRFQSMPGKKLFYDHELVGRDEYLKSALYNDLFSKYEIHNLLGACVNSDNGFAWFGISKRKRDAEFSGDELTKFQAIAPHVLRAMLIGRTNSNLFVSSAVYRNVLNRIKQSIVVISNGRVHEMNDAAEQFLDDTSFFKVINNRLVAGDRVSTDRLNAILTKDLEPGVPEKLLLEDMNDAVQYLVAVHAPKFEMSGGHLRPGNFRVLTIVPLVSDSSEQVDKDALSQIERSYRLAQAEAAVLQAVVTGTPLANLAEEKGIRLDTVRKQLKSTMRKLNVRSQKDIIRIVSAYTSGLD